MQFPSKSGGRAAFIDLVNCVPSTCGCRYAWTTPSIHHPKVSQRPVRLSHVFYCIISTSQIWTRCRLRQNSHERTFRTHVIHLDSLISALSSLRHLPNKTPVLDAPSHQNLASSLYELYRLRVPNPAHSLRLNRPLPLLRQSLIRNQKTVQWQSTSTSLASFCDRH